MDDLSILRVVATDPDRFIAFAGEVMLANKREGQRWQATFDFSMDTNSHPMNAYTGKATGRPGTRFMALLVEINDQDEPVDQDHKAASKAQGMGSLVGAALVKESGILRHDLHFTRFLWWKLEHMGEQNRLDLENDLPHGLVASISDSGGKVLADKKQAKRFNDHMVHSLCEVLSCREFKYSKLAADKFNKLRTEFISWASERQKRGNL